MRELIRRGADVNAQPGGMAPLYPAARATSASRAVVTGPARPKNARSLSATNRDEPRTPKYISETLNSFSTSLVPCKTTSRKRARARGAENIKKLKKNTRPTSCGTAPVPPPFLPECPGTCPGPGAVTQGCRREPRAQSGEVFFKVCRRFGILMDF